MNDNNILQIDRRLLSQWCIRLLDVEVKGMGAVKMGATLQEIELVLSKGDGLIEEERHGD